MSVKNIEPRFAILLLFMTAVATMRIPDAASITPWGHFITPIGAMGLFSGAYFTKQWKAVLFPLLTLFISDLVIQLFVFKGQYGIMYGGWYWIYSIFILITFMGKWIIKKVSVKKVLIAAVTASLTHWLLSDLMVWAGGSTDLRTMQPLSGDWNGLLQSYVQGFPFMKNFMTGTLLYSGIMFGAFEWVKKNNPVLQTA